MADPPKLKFDPTKDFKPRNDAGTKPQPTSSIPHRPARSNQNNVPTTSSRAPANPPMTSQQLNVQPRVSWAAVAAAGYSHRNSTPTAVLPNVVPTSAPAIATRPTTVSPAKAGSVPASVTRPTTASLVQTALGLTKTSSVDASLAKPVISIPKSNPAVRKPEKSTALAKGKFLLANHFEIKLGQYETVYSHEIHISFLPPPVQDNDAVPAPQPLNVSKPKRKRLIFLLLQGLQNQEYLPNPVATDYQKELITAEPLSDEYLTFDFDIDYYDEYLQGPAQNADTFRVTLGTPRAISLADLFAYHQTHPRTPQLTQLQVEDGINALNIIFSYRPYLDCFSQHPANNPEMATVKGKRFYGIPDLQLPVPRNLDTLTGRVLGGDHALLTVPGFVRSVRPTFSGRGYVDLNIYTKTGSFWRTGTVHELIAVWRADNPHNVTGLQEFLVGCPVRMTSREPGLNPFFRIVGLAPNAHNYPMRHPTHLVASTVRHYYETFHQWQIPQVHSVVIVQQRRNDPVLTIPADLLEVMPGKIKPDQIPRLGARLPERNYLMITQDGRRTFYSPTAGDPGATAFDLALDRAMAQAPVTTLAPPNLMYRTRNAPATILPVNDERLKKGQWDTNDAAFVNPAGGRTWKWTCVELIGGNAGATCTATGIQDFALHLEESFNRYGMQDHEWWEFDPNDPGQQQRRDHRFLPARKTLASLGQQFEAVKDVLQQCKIAEVELVVVLLPSQDQDLYGAIKRAGDQTFGVATVCHVLSATRSNRANKMVLWPKSPKHPDYPGKAPGGARNEDFLANLCMKINLKVEPTAVNQALNRSPTLLTAKSMLIGIDVAHAGGPRSGCPSIAAVVGSVNAQFSQYPASLGINECIPVPGERGQTQANEEVMDLTPLVLHRLRAYHDANHDETNADKVHTGIPDQLVVYRDGVSESQFEMCRINEYNRIQEALTIFLQEKGGDLEKRPPVTLICAIKRHHTRLFPDPAGAMNPDVSLLLHEVKNDKKTGVRTVNNNPLPGTLVTERITYGEGNDFFLIGHKAIQGTAIPVHYNILQNPCGYALQDIATMTYQLCFLFGRSRTSVGLCTPVYYADLATARARYYVRDTYYNPPEGIVITRYDGTTENQAFSNCLRINPAVGNRMYYI